MIFDPFATIRTDAARLKTWLRDWTKEVNELFRVMKLGAYDQEGLKEFTMKVVGSYVELEEMLHEVRDELNSTLDSTQRRFLEESRDSLIGLLALLQKVRNFKPGVYQYVLADGRGPFKTVQAAMDALGIVRETQPMTWEGLPPRIKKIILRRTP